MMKEKIEKIKRTCRVGNTRYAVSVEPRKISVVVRSYRDDKDMTNYALETWTAKRPRYSAYALVMHSRWNTEWDSGPEWYQLPSIQSSHFRFILKDTAKRLEGLADNDIAIREIAYRAAVAIGLLEYEVPFGGENKENEKEVNHE